jgi:hypothetical protein
MNDLKMGLNSCERVIKPLDTDQVWGSGGGILVDFKKKKKEGPIP